MNRFKKSIVLVLTALSLAACSSAEITPQASLGKPDAPVLIEEFSDFQCPACGQITLQIEEMILKNPNLARLQFYHFPLNYHKNAFLAAEAAECANDQGKFWEFSELNFKNQSNLTLDNLKTFAKNLNLDQSLFDDCLDNHKKRDLIKANIAEGKRRQLAYTPSIYVNGELVQWAGIEVFEAYLNGLR